MVHPLSCFNSLRSSFIKTMPSSSKKNALLARFFYGPVKKRAMWDQCITVFSWQQRLIDDAFVLCCTRFNKRYIQKWNIDTWRQYSTVLSTCEIDWNVNLLQLCKLFVTSYFVVHITVVISRFWHCCFNYRMFIHRYLRDMLTDFWIDLDLYLFIFMVMTLYLLWCPLRYIMSV